MEPCENRKMRLSRLLISALLAGLPWAAQGQTTTQTTGQTTPDLFSLCSFYPQGAPCPAVYQQALKDEANPASRSVRDAVTYYARYLKTPASFTDQDRAWLKDNAITLPDLNQANMGGLHNVIADPALANNAGARRDAVNNYISRALEAELFCGFNKCGDTPSGA
jgi:hypothetical protein